MREVQTTHRQRVNSWQIAFYWLTRTILIGCAKLMFWFKVTGADNVPRCGPVLIVCNHASHLDPPLVGIAVPVRIRPLAKIELFKVPVLARLISWLGAVAINRSKARAGIDCVVGLLNSGENILMFPEGTRSENGLSMGQCKLGAMQIALESGGCWIVPAVILGSGLALPKGSKWPKRVPIEVKFGEAYWISGRYGNSISKELLRKLTREMAWRMRELLFPAMRPTAEAMLSWYGQEAASEASSSTKTGG